MDRTARFAVFTAVGFASFSAGLSLTTACNHARPLEERTEPAARPAAPAPAAPAPAAPAPDSTAAKNAAAGIAAPARGSAPAPAPAVEPSRQSTAAAPSKAAGDGASLIVRRLVVTHAVSEREPAAPAELVAGAPVLAFIELANAEESAKSVTVTFERDGHAPVGHVTLDIPARSERWRTWARTRNLTAPGTWQAVVKGGDGVELGRVPFEVESANGPA